MKLLNGLNTDVAAVDQPGGTYRRARNMILDDLAGALATEKAPLLVDMGDYQVDIPRLQNMEVCGRFDVPGDRTIFGLKARNNTYGEASASEQIVELNDDGTVTTLEWASGEFEFDASNPFQGVGYINGAQQLILVWSNGVHKPLYINTATYRSNQEEPLLVFPEAKFPMVRPYKRGNQDASGSIFGGTYSFFIAYEVVDGTDNLTQYGPAIGAFQIGNGTGTSDTKFRTSAKMKFYGLDTRYNFARIYAVRNYDGVEYVYYTDRIGVQEDLEWTYTGEEIGAAEAVDALYINSASYTAASTITVSDDRLFMANLTGVAVTEDEGQTVANNIDVFWSVDEAGLYAAEWDNVQLLGTAGTERNDDYVNTDYRDLYPNRGTTENKAGDPTAQTTANSDHQGLLGGFMPGEVYALYISFLYNDGTWSQAFHIPAGGDTGDFTSTARDGVASLNKTTTNIRTSGTFDQILNGKTGYFENASGTYPSAFGSAFNANSLNGVAHRHHVMPTAKQAWQATRTAQGGDDLLNHGDFTNEYGNQTVGLYFDNVVIPADLATKVQGYKIFYAKQNTAERRIKAYAPVWRMFSDYTNNQQCRIYDPFLLSEKPAVGNWKLDEVYKGGSYLEQNSYVMQSANIEEYAYMPANTDNGTFNNEYREGALCLKTDNNLSDSNNWHSGYPGFYGGKSLVYSTNSSKTAYGWNIPFQLDTVELEFPERGTDPGILNDNFVSTFGGYMRRFGASTDFSYNNQPAKNDSTYPVVYAAGGHGGAHYNAVTGAATGGSGNLTLPYLGWGMNGGSFGVLYEEYDNYFLNYEAQVLVDTHDFVEITTTGTYKSNGVVRGGDTWTAPVVVEFMGPNNPTGGPAPDDANSEIDFNRLYKTSYMTWTRVHPAKVVLDGQKDWTTLTDYYYVSAADNNPYYGEDMNQRTFGAHWFKGNDSKAAFPFTSDSLMTTEYPNRIIRSSKQGYESTTFQWGTFAPADYYDNALGKDSIRNIADYQGELIIHHGNGIFKTRSKFNIDASGTNVFVGSGDIFQAPPQELFPDTAGYAGLTHWSDALECRVGYVWVDRDGKRIFMLGQGVKELSAKGMRNFFRDEYLELDTANMTSFGDFPVINDGSQGGYTIGFDPYNDRLMFTKRYVTAQTPVGGGTQYEVGGTTLSYCLRHDCWASMHSYLPQQYFQTYSKLFAFYPAGDGSFQTDDYLANESFMFCLNGTDPGTKYLADGTEDTEKDTCYVDAVFNMGGPISKVWQNFNWVTRAGGSEGEGVKNETFDRARVYNDEAVSAYSTDFRLTDNRWQFNRFRNDKAAAHTGSIFQADGVTFDDDLTLIDNTKPWYSVQRFVSDYAIIRLETLNSTGNRLYLLDVGATARRATR